MTLKIGTRAVPEYLPLSDLVALGSDILRLQISVQQSERSEGSFQNLDQVEMILGSVLNFNPSIKDRFFYKVRWQARPESDIRPQDSLVSENELRQWQPQLLLEYYRRFHHLGVSSTRFLIS